MSLNKKNIAIIGGCGHVGLPLGVKFAKAGARVFLVDTNEVAVKKVNAGQFPFLEKGGDKQLKEALENGLTATSDATVCRNVRCIIFVIGTPVDEHLNPKLSDVIHIFSAYEQYFSPGVLVVMRSTLFPGTMQFLSERLKQSGKDVKLAFCPERVSQGYALDEIDDLPQIVSAFDEDSFLSAYEFFAGLAPEIVKLTPLEAELTKLMANSWRYLEFAIANQFYMIAEKSGVNFNRIFEAMRYNYPRAKGYKSPGLAAGPCLFKDTMQLASFFDNQFHLGHAGMLVNEGLATFLAEKTAKCFSGSLWGKTVGILGMTFKANNDDIRESLSYKVKKCLEFKGAKVLCHDPYLVDLPDLKIVLHQSDALVLCTPHDDYKNLDFNKPVVDVWNMFNKEGVEVLPGTAKLRKVSNA